MTRIFYVPLRNTGVERTPNKSQHTKLTLEKKILPPLLPGFELATFRWRVRRSYQQAFPAPNSSHTYHALFCAYYELYWLVWGFWASSCSMMIMMVIIKTFVQSIVARCYYQHHYQLHYDDNDYDTSHFIIRYVLCYHQHHRITNTISNCGVSRRCSRSGRRRRSRRM